ncbi:MAG: hypothetical protein PHW08_10700 [Kiritimatiellae bacterium]|nr:hypothetical protein [Kiritimatiellia bacterium]
MTEESRQPQPSPATPSTEPASGMIAPPVVRKRSSHRHHRHNGRRRPGMTEFQKRRTLHLTVFAYAAPTLLAVIGGVLLVVANINPEPSMRPKGLNRLGWQMLLIGLGFFLVALIVDWTRRTIKFLRERREKSQMDRQTGRRRSSHHRHRRHRS